jgi:pyruvate dehydrogenase E2 component (dihydrolipoamide acetyltransferase)
MADFTMPALGADMETGEVVEWRVQPGDRVRPGDVVAVVETHKGAIDVECFLDGAITELAPLRQPLPVGAVLARVVPVGEAVVPAPAPAAAAAAPIADAAVPTAAPTEAASTPTTAPTAPTAPTTPTAPVPPSPARPPGALPGARPRASPAARRAAQAQGLDLRQLPGSGADGAIVLADVARAAAAAGPVPVAVRTPAGPPRTGFDPVQMRAAIAAAMGRSKREIPHYYLAETLDFGPAQAWLDAWNAAHDPEQRLLPAALLLKAAAHALAQVPQLNGFWHDGAYQPGAGIHLGWAIALRGGGLIAPAVRHADRLALPQVMAALRDLVQRARSGGLRSSELTDPTVTVTSLGERGAAQVLGVIYPPQVALIGLGRVQTLPWVVDGQVLPRPVVQATLAADHRASDGAVGSKLLAAMAQALQSPDAL